MKVNAWNVYSIIRENARLVAATDHDASTARIALDEAEELAREWNAKEERPDMIVTILTCNGFVRTVPHQLLLGA